MAGARRKATVGDHLQDRRRRDGIVGALVGGFLAGVMFNVKDPTGINIETIVVAVIGAVVVVFVAGVLGLGGSRRTA